jgi:3D (Asp-Asp-Asp) domain-containing protein
MKYKIQSQDTLFALAEKYCSDGNKWTLIRDANPGIDPNNLITGNEIEIPCAGNGSPSEKKLRASFYSRQEVGNSPTACEIRGATLTEALQGQGLLQCAVAQSIPCGTQFTLVLWDGRQVRAIAADRGTAIDQGRVDIDIFVDTNDEATHLGIQTVTAIF